MSITKTISRSTGLENPPGVKDMASRLREEDARRETREFVLQAIHQDAQQNPLAYLLRSNTGHDGE